MGLSIVDPTKSSELNDEESKLLSHQSIITLY